MLICEQAGCGKQKKKTSRDCSMHAERRRQGRDPHKPPRFPHVKKKCSIWNCERFSIAKELCQKHYERKRNGRPMQDPTAPDPDDPSTWRMNKTAAGYMTRSYLGGKKTLLEHRRIFSKSIGRKLERHEEIHHINGVRDDNRIENLELWSTSQPSGQRVPDKVAWAVEILGKYPSEVDEAGIDVLRSILESKTGEYPTNGKVAS